MRRRAGDGLSNRSPDFAQAASVRPAGRTMRSGGAQAPPNAIMPVSRHVCINVVGATCPQQGGLPDSPRSSLPAEWVETRSAACYQAIKPVCINRASCWHQGTQGPSWADTSSSGGAAASGCRFAAYIPHCVMKQNACVRQLWPYQCPPRACHHKGRL